MAKELGVSPRSLSRFAFSVGLKASRKSGYPSLDDFKRFVEGVPHDFVGHDHLGRPMFLKGGWANAECHHCKKSRVMTPRVRNLVEFFRADMAAKSGRVYIQLYCWCSGRVKTLVPLCFVPTQALQAITSVQ